MKWKYTSSLKTRIYPQIFPNASGQQSLDHSYCKRETSLTKLKNSKSVMILVVRLTSSPIPEELHHFKRVNNGTYSYTARTFVTTLSATVRQVWRKWGRTIPRSYLSKDVSICGLSL
jgi:hypothetical protein